METILKILAIMFQFGVDPQSERQANESVTKFAQGAMRQLRAIGEVAATIAFDKIVQNLLKATSQAEDTAFVFENIYGDLSDAQAAWAEEFADTYKRSATKVKQSLAEIQHEMVGFTKAGTEEQKRNAAELSKAIEETALNLGAFYGMDTKTAISTLMSAVEGSEGAMDTLRVGQGTTLAARRQEARNQLVAEGAIAYDATYQKLSKYEKALVNLRAVMLANGDAMDALARSQDNYSTMQANLNESLAELKETLGTFFMPIAKKIVDILTMVLRVLNDGIKGIKAVTDELGYTDQVVSGLAFVMTVLVGIKVVQWAKGVIDSFGKIATAAAKIAEKAAGAEKGVEAVGKAAGAAGKSASSFGSAAASLGVWLGIALLALGVAQDINKAIKGEKSVTGTILEKLGIDAKKAVPFLEGLRNAIVLVTAALTVLKVVSLATGTALMATPIGWIVAALAALIGIIAVVVKHWDKIKAGASSAFGSIKDKVSELKNKFTEWFDSLPVWAQAVIKIIQGPGAAIEYLIKNWDKVKDATENAIESVKNRVKSIRTWFQDQVDAVRNFFNSVFDWLRDKLNSIPDWMLVFGGPIGWLMLLVKHFDAVKQAAKEAWEWIQKAVYAVQHPFNPVRDEDKDKKFTDTVANILDWTPLKVVGDAMRYFGNGSVSGSTLAMAGGTYNSGNRNVTQNITFNQAFNGPEAMEQKTVRAAENFKDDSTGFLARIFGSLKG